MARRCIITGRGPNTANAVSHSNRRVKRRQLPNLQWKRLWVPSEQRFVRIRVSTSALRSIDKLGVERVLPSAGVLSKKRNRKFKGTTSHHE
ncbi:MAG: 50S ribosomal protein L28 [Deltaproteobacteria bacterium]|nr:50S ribosomal protein L28 [Deltaproteobacteria bacterium]